MFDLEKVDTLANQLIILKQELGKDNYWNKVAEIIAQSLSFYFVGIYLPSPTNEFVVFKGGSGEAGKVFLKIGYKCKISAGKHQSWHAGTAAYSNELQLINWVKGKIFSYQIIENKIADIKLLDEIGMFWSPQLPFTQGELFIPIRIEHETIGIMEINVNTEPEFTEEEIIKLYLLANQIALIIKRIRNI